MDAWKRVASSSAAAWENPDPVPRSREDRLLLAGERLEAERDAQVAANRAYEDYRETGRDTTAGGPTKPCAVRGG